MTQNQPDRLERLEAALGRFAELTIANVQRHDQALTRLEDSASRHDEALTRIEEQTSRNSEAIANLTTQAQRHDEQLFRIEGAITDLTTKMNQIGSRVDALTTSTTETIQLVAQQAVQSERDRQAWQSEIREIWQYLRYEPRNGNGRSE